MLENLQMDQSKAANPVQKEVYSQQVSEVLSALALAFEPPEPDTMTRTPRLAPQGFITYGLVSW